MVERPRDPQGAPPWIAEAAFRWTDRLRRAQGAWMEALGHGPIESPWTEILRRPGLRVRDYGGARDAPVLMIVPAPIKRAYIWDLEPDVSVVRRARAAGLAVVLLEWIEEPGAEAGLDDHADRLIGAALDAVAARRGPVPVVLAGHSLGGTLATIFACLWPARLAGLVLIEAPLAFGPGAGVFGPVLARDPGAPERLGAGPEPVPGAVLDAASVAAAPGTFLGEPARDLIATAGDEAARATHQRVRRWTLDEFDMPARLFADVVGGLYRDDKFAAGGLVVGGRAVGPAGLVVPTLAVIDPSSDLLPPAAVRPVLAAATGCRSRIVEHGGEVGVLFQHVAALVGRRAHSVLWPEILAWVRTVTAPPTAVPPTGQAKRPDARPAGRPPRRAAAPARRRR